MKQVNLIVVLLIAMFINPVLLLASENLLINPGAETGDIQGWISEPENWWIAADDHITPQEGT